MTSAVLERPAAASTRPVSRLPRWWPLAAVLVGAAALRISTLDLQSFWYDEAFTPVRVLHTGLGATLRSMVHSENSPPLWYLIAWVDVRLFGDGEIALRLPSALAGIGTVALAWAIGRELAGRRCALVCALLVACSPLFVWYSQEARVYALFAFTSALAMLCCLRARREPTPARMAAFALSGVLALVTHCFAAFLLAGMALWLLRDRAARRGALAACAALAVAGLALLPLVIAQGGHGTQWIGRWALSSRVQAAVQYAFTGYSGAPLGHGIELLVALPLIAGLALALRPASARGPVAARKPAPAPARAADASAAQGDLAPTTARAGDACSAPSAGGELLDSAGPALVFAASGILLPLALAIVGADYFAPRNLLGAMVPLTAAVAVAVTSRRAGRAGVALGVAGATALLAISIDVNLSPRLQRGDWRGLAHALGHDGPTRALTTVELGSIPLEYYLPGLRNLPRGASVTADEIAETGYSPLRTSARRPPARGFALVRRIDVNGLIAYRFRASYARAVTESTLRRHVITLAHPEVLVSKDASVTYPAGGG
jgi:Dolichyl-phosphate-mannose-protein mannosyltransferase